MLLAHDEIHLVLVVDLIIEPQSNVVTVGAGRAFFRVELLRQLRSLIDEQMARKEAR